MTQEVALLGEAPNRASSAFGNIPFFYAGPEISREVGLTWPTGFNDFFVQCNMLPAWPGRDGKGDLFPIDEARLNVPRVLRATSHCKRVIVFGRRVERALRFHPNNFFEWFTFRSQEWVIVPHPSKVSHWWNDPLNCSQSTRFWTTLKGLTCA